MEDQLNIIDIQRYMKYIYTETVLNTLLCWPLPVYIQYNFRCA